MNRNLYFVLLLPLLLLACTGDNKSGTTDSTAVKTDFKIPDNVNFSEHIAPVIFKNCAPCHRPDGMGPFPLLTWNDVKRKAKTIRLVVPARVMPPWPADPHYSEFIGQLQLGEADIALLCAWIDKGCPKGDTTKLPPVPVFPKGSMLGTPDFVVHMQKAVPIAGNNRDKFLLMKLPYELNSDTFLRAIEFVPDKRKIVHHVNGFLIQYDGKRANDRFSGAPFVNSENSDYAEAYKEMKIAYNDGSFPMLTPSAVNYLPGVLPYFYPDGIGGLTVKKDGAVFLKDIHYGPSSTDQQDSSYFNFFFMKSPPERPLRELQMGTFGVSKIEPPLLVPADSVKTFVTRYTVKEDMSIVTINPHMHLLGKSFKAFATTPQGDTIKLINIPKWDFRWQYFYTFKKMVKIPAGSEIKVIGVYDNTRANPLNPFNPPRPVGEREGSMRTTDEMFQFIINYLPYRPGDENISLEQNATAPKTK